jgi:hypothetical protein
MLKMLRAMNQWELAEVCRAAGVPEGSRPEEIIRALSGAWWAVPWGGVEEERALLLRAAEALNLMPRLRRHRHQLGLVERMVYGALIQQAFVAAPEEQQNALLSAAETHLGPGHPALTAAVSSDLSLQERRQLALQRLVGTGPGLRAMTQALAALPVPTSSTERAPGPTALLAALASAGPDAWSGRVVEWVKARRGPDLGGLFAVLHLCWRQRLRLVMELHTGIAGLVEEEKRLLSRLQALAEDRAAARRRLPWHRRTSSAVAVGAGALAAASAQSILAAGVHEATFFALGASCAWTITSLIAAATAGATPDRRRLLEQIRRSRRQRQQLELQIAQLEE